MYVYVYDELHYICMYMCIIYDTLRYIYIYVYDELHYIYVHMIKSATYICIRV